MSPRLGRLEPDRQNPAVRNAVSASFRAWQQAIATGLERHGGTAAADAQALMMLTVIEGALLVSRGMRSAAPYDAAIDLLRRGLAAKR